jgi:hypothetical protein
MRKIDGGKIPDNRAPRGFREPGENEIPIASFGSPAKRKLDSPRTVGIARE